MFGFPPVTRAIYKNNFINLVVFQVQFDPVSNIMEDSSLVKQIFSKICPIETKSQQSEFKIEIRPNQTPVVSSDDGAKRIQLKSADGSRTIDINNNSFTYSVTGSAYTCFENLKVEIDQLESYLSTFSISELTRVSIRKVNIINIVDAQLPSDVLRQLMSSDLLSNLGYFPSQACIQRNMNNIIYSKDNNSLVFQYGVIVPGPQTGNCQIILDIDRIDNNTTFVGDLWGKAANINSEIFNVFTWAVSDKLREYLSK